MQPDETATTRSRALPVDPRDWRGWQVTVVTSTGDRVSGQVGEVLLSTYVSAVALHDEQTQQWVVVNLGHVVSARGVESAS